MEVKYGKLGGEVKLRSYERLMLDLQDKVSAYRSLLRLVQSDSFQEKYAAADDKRRKEVDLFIVAGQLSQVKRWCMSVDYSEMSVRLLRTVARDRSIRDYHLLNKVELISELEQYDAGRQNFQPPPGDA